MSLCVEIKGQLVGVSFLPQPCVFQISDSWLASSTFSCGALLGSTSHSALPQVQAYLDWAHQCTLVSLTIDREVGPSPLGLLSGWTHACEHNMDGWEPSTGRYESKRRNVYAMHEWWRGSCWQTLTLFWHGPSALLRVMLSYSSLCHFPKP